MKKAPDVGRRHRETRWKRTCLSSYLIKILKHVKYTRSDRHLALAVAASGSIYELCVPPQSQASNNAHVTMAVCRSATTSTQRQDCHTSMNTKSRSKKLRIFSVSHLQDIRGRNDSRISMGQTREGRYLKVIYVPDPVPDSVFVISAYELGPKAKRAIRRRRRRKP